MMQLISCSPRWPPVIYNSVNRHWSIAFISVELEIPPITSIGSFRSKISLEWDFECCIWRQLVKSTVLRENNSWKDNYSKKALVYHLSRMFMDVIYRVKSCKNKQTNKERKKQKKNKNKNLRIYAVREHHFIDYRISYGTGLGRGYKSTWYRLVNTNCYVLESITLLMI